MTIQIREVRSKSDLKTFIHLPALIHKRHEAWIPPIYADEWKFFNPKKNKVFSYSDTILALAFNNGKAVGRIMGIINHRYNEQQNTSDARFEFMECYDETKVAHSLLAFVENWAQQKGMTKMVGPMGFSDKDPQGFVIEGFDKQAVIASNCNFGYMIKLVTSYGYSKQVDLLDYIIEIPEETSAIYRRIFERAEKSSGLIVHEFSSRKQLKPLIKPIFELINTTYRHIYGFVPLDDEEVNEFAKRYLPIVNPDFVKVLTFQDRMVAFIIAIPCMSDGIKKSGGRLFPFGIYHILQSAKRTNKLDLMLGAIEEDFRNRGADVMMGTKIFESCRKHKITKIESHLVLETNTKMLAELTKIGGQVLKRFRIYQKAL
jgi:hypothetical protein